ncbi:uncharacterized protein LOC143209417 isoform X2 [Lasioglossum baleicum]|uniref:uncharacterized protein LOC143209417 isoform X2 n=1 Tax=Lasioglossum baleicum TaxID=434251 RepID=UPI003FCDC9E5
MSGHGFRGQPQPSVRPYGKAQVQPPRRHCLALARYLLDSSVPGGGTPAHTEYPEEGAPTHARQRNHRFTSRREQDDRGRHYADRKERESKEKERQMNYGKPFGP